jgi:hypothetical protein
MRLWLVLLLASVPAAAGHIKVSNITGFKSGRQVHEGKSGLSQPPPPPVASVARINTSVRAHLHAPQVASNGARRSNSQSVEEQLWGAGLA